MPEEEFDYYKALKDQNYSTLLDNQIQLDNARQRALKNTNVGLAAAGFDSSGYSQLARQGIESQYLQAFQQNQADAAKDLGDRIANEQSSQLNNLYAGLEEMYTQDEFDKYLERQGLLKDGVLDQEAFNNRFGEQNWAQFNSDIGARRDSLSSNQNATNTPTAASYSQIAENPNAACSDEINFFNSKNFDYIRQNMKNGDCIKLSDNVDDKIHVYYKYENGQYVPISESEYNKSGGKYWIRSHKGTKDMVVDYNGKTIHETGATDKGAAASNIMAGILTALTGGLGAVPAFGIAHATNRGHRDYDPKEVKQNYEEYLKALRNGN